MTWLLAAHRSELAKPGDFVVLHSGAQQIAAFNLDGEVLASDNICAHRGSRVLRGNYGTQPLVCPYHGMRGKATIGEQYLTQWLGDWLFVGEGDDVIENDLADLGPLLAGISQQITRRHAFSMMHMPCDWKVAVENTLEDYHVPTVHADTFGKLGLRLDTMERHGRNSAALYTLTAERMVKAGTDMAHYYENVRPDHYFHIFLWPFTCLSSVGGFSFSLQHYMPAGGMTQFHTRLYAGKERSDSPDLSWWYQEAAKFNERVFQQDSEACAMVAGQGRFLTEQEDRVRWFREASGE